MVRNHDALTKNKSQQKDIVCSPRSNSSFFQISKCCQQCNKKQIHIKAPYFPPDFWLQLDNGEARAPAARGVGVCPSPRSSWRRRSSWRFLDVWRVGRFRSKSMRFGCRAIPSHLVIQTAPSEVLNSLGASLSSQKVFGGLGNECVTILQPYPTRALAPDSVRRALVTPLAGCGARHEVLLDALCSLKRLAQWWDMALNARELWTQRRKVSWMLMHFPWWVSQSHLSMDGRRFRPTHFVPKWMTVRRWAKCSLGALRIPCVRKGRPPEFSMSTPDRL